VNEFADTAVKHFPLGCHQKPDGVSDICVDKHVQDQQEHLQSNVVERKSTRPPSGMKKWLGSQEKFVTVKQWEATHSISLEDQLRGAPAALFYNINPAGSHQNYVGGEVSEHAMHYSSPHGPCGPFTQQQNELR
jgi:hypothetical protein